MRTAVPTEEWGAPLALTSAFVCVIVPLRAPVSAPPFKLRKLRNSQMLH